MRERGKKLKKEEKIEKIEKPIEKIVLRLLGIYGNIKLVNNSNYSECVRHKGASARFVLNRSR